jgi:hypothetical protein
MPDAKDLLKHVANDDAVSFKDDLKGMLNDKFQSERDEVAKEVGGTIAGEGKTGDE